MHNPVASILWIRDREFARVTAAVGTAASPSYTFKGYSGTGFFAAAANAIGVSVAGTESFRFNANGDVALASGKKLFLDGVNGGGNTYLVESAPDTFDLYVGGILVISSLSTGAVLTTPDIGTPSAGVLTNCTGLPSGGVAGLGTMAAENIGVSGSFVAGAVTVTVTNGVIVSIV